MSAGFQDGPVTVHQGDVRDVLAQLPAESVQVCVTSPPYWGLRDYGTATWEGGDAGCDHRKAGTHVSSASTRRSDGCAHVGPYEGEKAATVGYPFGVSCGKCGARRIDSQLGLEATPDEYVASMVAVFREVRRVLRKDGTLWLNLGDSYAANRTYQVTDNKHVEVGNSRGAAVPSGLKPKDLIGVPWRVAFALQADGWWLRSEITWAKKAPMPESVRDRPTCATEKVFLLTRSPRYFYDHIAVKEPSVSNHASGNGYGRPEQLSRGGRGQTQGWTPEDGEDGRNMRNFWLLGPDPYPDAHFATYPEDLVIPCIKAGSREGDVVLDPFAGSGTTLAVARRLGRRAVGIELNPAYVELIRARVGKASLPLLEIEA